MARKTKQTSSKSGRRAAPAVAEVEAVEAVSSGGMGIDDGIVLSTTILLGIAVTLVFLARSAYVG